MDTSDVKIAETGRTENRYRTSDGDKQQTRGASRGTFVKRHKKRVCHFCEMKLYQVDYKNTDLLRRYVSDRGRIKPARITGTCAKHQRQVAAAVKKGRNISLI